MTDSKERNNRKELIGVVRSAFGRQVHQGRLRIQDTPPTLQKRNPSQDNSSRSRRRE